MSSNEIMTIIKLGGGGGGGGGRGKLFGCIVSFKVLTLPKQKKSMTLQKGHLEMCDPPRLPLTQLDATGHF